VKKLGVLCSLLAVAFLVALVGAENASAAMAPMVSMAFDCDNQYCKLNGTPPGSEPPTCADTRDAHNCNITIGWVGGQSTVTCAETNCGGG
jgi:hypothetical protein